MESLLIMGDTSKEFEAIVKEFEHLGIDGYIELYLKARHAEEQLKAFKIIAVSVLLGMAVIIPLVIYHG